MEKKLHRSRTDKVIAGVGGGLGEYFGVDPAFVRILFVILTFASGIGIIAYLIFWISLHKRPEGVAIDQTQKSAAWSRYLPGIILVLVGVVFFVHENLYWFNLDEVWDRFWPVILIALGLVLILYRRDHKTARLEQPLKSETLNEHNGGTTL